MTRTDTPTPFAEGQRNADILTAPSWPSLALDFARECGRFYEIVDLLVVGSKPGSRWSEEAVAALYARGVKLLTEIATLRAEMAAARVEPADIDQDPPDRLRRALDRAAGRHLELARRMCGEEAA